MFHLMCKYTMVLVCAYVFGDWERCSWWRTKRNPILDCKLKGIQLLFVSCSWTIAFQVKYTRQTFLSIYFQIFFLFSSSLSSRYYSLFLFSLLYFCVLSYIKYVRESWRSSFIHKTMDIFSTFMCLPMSLCLPFFTF